MNKEVQCKLHCYLLPPQPLPPVCSLAFSFSVLTAPSFLAPQPLPPAFSSACSLSSSWVLTAPSFLAPQPLPPAFSSAFSALTALSSLAPQPLPPIAVPLESGNPVSKPAIPTPANIFFKSFVFIYYLLCHLQFLKKRSRADAFPSYKKDIDY
jgi:hypothetical protein